MKRVLLAYSFVALMVSGCQGAGAITCAVIKAADAICPFIVVQLQDGGVEAIPREPVLRAAEAQRAARLAAERDGGYRRHE